VNKPEALRRVASATAAWLYSSELGEVLSIDTESMSDADYERMAWAVEEVRRRLYLMGGAE